MSAIPRRLRNWPRCLRSSLLYAWACFWGRHPLLRLLQPSHGYSLARLLSEIGITAVALGPTVGGRLEQMFEGVDVEEGTADDFELLVVLVQTLGCVVTVDSLIAHIAGAASVQCHLLLDLHREALWGAAGDSTPWYPDVRIYREHRESGWELVLEQLGRALGKANHVEEPD